MKTLNIFLLFSLFCMSSITSCQSKNETLQIEKIIVGTFSGGKGSGSSELIITKDTIFFESKNRIFPKNNKKIKIKTPHSLWKKLLDNMDIRDFGLVKSNPGHVQYDGIDVTISVYTEGKIYSITNAEDDKINFKKIQQFYTIITDINYRLSYGLNGKTFSAKIGSVCMETSPPNPCASYQIYLELNFKEFEVETIEKGINSCGNVEYEHKYLSEWYYERTDKIIIKKLISDNQPIIENNSLQYDFNKNELIGIATKKQQENYIFSEKE